MELMVAERPKNAFGLLLNIGARNVTRKLRVRARAVGEGEPIYIKTIGRLIGNVVPVNLGKAIGKSIIRHIRDLEAPLERAA